MSQAKPVTLTARQAEVVAQVVGHYLSTLEKGRTHVFSRDAVKVLLHLAAHGVPTGDRAWSAAQASSFVQDHIRSAISLAEQVPGLQAALAKASKQAKAKKPTKAEPGKGPVRFPRPRPLLAVAESPAPSAAGSPAPAGSTGGGRTAPSSATPATPAGLNEDGEVMESGLAVDRR